MQHLHRSTGRDLFKGAQESSVDLHGEHPGAGIGEGHRQRAAARADLDDPLPGRDARQAHHPYDGVRVDDEVLSERAARPDLVAAEQVGHGCGAERHPAYPYSLVATRVATADRPWLGAALLVEPVGHAVLVLRRGSRREHADEPRVVAPGHKIPRVGPELVGAVVAAIGLTAR